MPVLSVIVVSYNVADLLQRALASLEQEISGMQAEVFVVDNASRDGTPGLVKSRFPWVRLIASEVNLGFAGGNNFALPLCTGKYVLLLNPDTLVHPGSLRRLIQYLEDHPDVGAVGPAVRLPDGSIQPECARNLPSLTNLFPWLLQLDKTTWRLWRRLRPGSPGEWTGGPPRGNPFDRLNLLSWARDRSCEVECLSGACMLVRNAVIRRIGLMDESLVVYFEDSDYCQRIRKAGFAIHYVHDASITHFWQQSSAHLNRDGQLYAMTCHSKWLFLRKHKGPRHAGVFSAMALVAAPVRIAVSLAALAIARAEGRTFWRRQLAMARGLARWGYAWKKEPPIQFLRTGK